MRISRILSALGIAAALSISAAQAKDWTKASQANHADALKAYRAWWEKAKTLKPDEARTIEPLKGTNLHWY